MRLEAEASGKALVEEMGIQRDLLFRKKEIATAAAEQTKRECTQDVRKLTPRGRAIDSPKDSKSTIIV